MELAAGLMPGVGGSEGMGGDQPAPRSSTLSRFRRGGQPGCWFPGPTGRNPGVCKEGPTFWDNRKPLHTVLCLAVKSWVLCKKSHSLQRKGGGGGGGGVQVGSESQPPAWDTGPGVELWHL